MHRLRGAVWGQAGALMTTLAMVIGLLIALAARGGPAQAAAVSPLQAVSGGSTQVTLALGRGTFVGPAVDRAGNVYVLDGSAGDVLEFPKIDGGYGPVIALAFAGPKIQNGYSSMTVDGSGDLFLGVNLSAAPPGVGEVIELPRTQSGFRAAVTLPTEGLQVASALAVDATGNVFVADNDSSAANNVTTMSARVFEIPKSGPGFGPPTLLPFTGLQQLEGLGVDAAGDVLVAANSLNARGAPANGQVVKLPRSGSSFGPQAPLPFAGAGVVTGFAVDGTGDAFVADEHSSTGSVLSRRVVKLSSSVPGLGSGATLPFRGLGGASGVAVDAIGDVLVGDFSNPSAGVVDALVTPPATAAPMFTADSPPTTGTVGAAYSYTFASSGTPAPTFTVASGALPGGLDLDVTTGALSGTPTSAGSSTFTIKADNGVSPAAIGSSHNVIVSAAAPPVSICSTQGTPAAGSSLPPGGFLVANQQLRSSNGAFSLIMQGDGNLVEYLGSRPIYATNTAGYPGACAVMQADGNLVVYSLSNVPLFSTGSSGPGASLLLQNDANVVIYLGGRPIYANRVTGAVLAPGGSLSVNQELLSANTTYVLLMQTDGNLVEYQGGRPLFSTNTGGHPGASALMQNDGNLVVYQAGQPLFSTNTGGHPGALAVLQDDANLVIYQAGRPIYANSASLVFSQALLAALAQRTGVVSASVLDLSTGQSYQFRPGQVGITASIVKVEILGTLLAEAQAARRGLSPNEQSLATAMIVYSDNNAATALWNEVGGAPAVASFDRTVGMTSTAPAYAWGLTTTTAADQVTLMEHLVEPNGVLTDQSRAYELTLMEQVTPSEAWGVSVGPPLGTTIALKNGWLPISSGWTVNSIGWVNGSGRNYLIAVLTAGSPSEVYGIDSTQMVSSSVWAGLAP